MNTEFLQSREWLRLQEVAGRPVIPWEEEDFLANGVVHDLPIVGAYLYVPRGPILENAKLQRLNVKKEISDFVTLAKEKGMKWVRIEPETEELLEATKKAVSYKIVKAPHDMQPREVFRIDLFPSEEELLAAMKPKTRYNIRLAEKRGVKVFETREEKHLKAFLDLISLTSDRKGITAHPRSYYEKFLNILPKEMCQLFVAEYKGEIVAGNLMMFYGDTATYLHGGSSDYHREVMAPYLLQWEQIKTAKSCGFKSYDFGGVKTGDQQQTTNGWKGITKFKTGFSPEAKSTVYPGAYDIILDSWSYFLYDVLRILRQWQKGFF